MPRLPGAEDFRQRQAPQSRGQVVPVRGAGAVADAQAYAGRSLAAAGNSLAGTFDEMGARIQRRQDAIERVRDFGRFSEEAQTELLRVSTEEDFSRPEALKAYNEFLSTKATELLGNHKGSGDSQAALAERIEQQRIQLITHAGGLAAEAQQSMVMDAIGKQINVYTSKAYENPAGLEQSMLDFERDLADMAPALSPAEERMYRDTARSQIAQSSVESLVARGSYADAEGMMANPALAEILPAKFQQTVRMSIDSARMQMRQQRMQGITKAQTELDYLTAMIGREPTQAERLRRAGVSPPTSSEASAAQAGANAVVKAETILKRPLTDAERQKIAGVYAAPAGGGAGSKLFGGGQDALTLTYMMEHVNEWESGMMSDAEERAFSTALTLYTQPKEIQDPATGLYTKVNPQIPPELAEAARRRGIDVSSVPVAVGAPSETLPQAVQLPGVPQSEPLQASAVPEEGNPGFQAAKAQIPENFNLWESASDISGPVPAVVDFLSRSPVIGNFVRAPETTKARTTWPLLTRELIRTLQDNPRKAEGERLAIERELDINPSFWDNPASLRDRAAAVDTALEARLNKAVHTLENPQISIKERQWAMDAVNAITEFRPLLGVPRQMPADESQQDTFYDSLEPGQKFIGPDGLEYTKGEE